MVKRNCPKCGAFRRRMVNELYEHDPATPEEVNSPRTERVTGWDCKKCHMIYPDGHDA